MLGNVFTPKIPSGSLGSCFPPRSPRRSNSVIYKSQALSGLDALQLLLVMWHGHQPKLSHLSSLSSLLSSVCHKLFPRYVWLCYDHPVSVNAKVEDTRSPALRPQCFQSA